jgi:hypothetical protein
MYKNPLNNGKLSDNNSLKKQRDYGSIIKKYENIKLETKPTELQKYYQYLTYQQPILDELNYVAERMRNEDIKTKTDDYNFVEDLKIKREKEMKENSQREESIKQNRDSLFDYSSTVKQDDPTPVINTDIEMEMETPIIKQQQRINNKDEIDNLMGDLFDSFNLFDEMSIADTVPIKEEKFELVKAAEKKKKEKTPEQLEEIEAKKAASKAIKEAAKAEKKAASKAIKEAAKAEKKSASKAKKGPRIIKT